MPETEHTSLPWVTSQTGLADERDDMLIHADLGDHRIESIGRIWNSHGRARVNAAFIVRACNNFEKLLATCRTVLLSLQNVLSVMDDEPVCEELVKDCNRLVTQIRQAEEEE